MKGIYQHCKEKHLHRYLAEFDFRYNHRVGLGYSDIDRTFAAIKAVEGKRLTYRQPLEADIPFLGPQCLCAGVNERGRESDGKRPN
jgi:hypothetical protein